MTIVRPITTLPARPHARPHDRPVAARGAGALALALALPLCACRAVSVPGVRRTHADRWHEAASQFEADLAERRAAGTLGDDRASGAPATARVVRTTYVTGPPSGVSIHDVNDLVAGVPSFAAPELGLVAPSGGLEGEPAAITRTSGIDPALLEELVRASVAPGTWDEDGNSVDVVNGQLIVRRR